MFVAHQAHQGVAVHPRHHHVRDNQVDRHVGRVDDVEGRLAVLRLQNPIALVTQRPDAEQAYRVLVLDQKHGAAARQVGLAAGGHGRQSPGRGLGIAVRRVAGQIDTEVGAPSWRAVDDDEAAGLADDAVDGRQPKPGTGADFLGREEGLEDAPDVLLRDAGAGVHHLDQRIVSGRHQLGAPLHGLVNGKVGGPDGQRAAAEHGVACVDGEVNDDLIELAGIDPHRTQFAPVLDIELNGLADEPVQQVGKLRQRLGDVQDDRLQGLFARKRKQLAHQVDGAVDVLLDLHDVGKRGIVGPVALQQEVAEPNHGGQQVVEVVGHAAGQLPDGLHLLGLDEL